MQSQMVKGGTDLFYTYLTQYKDQARHENFDGYYHVDVVVEAYNQGFSDGKESGKKDFVEEMRKNIVERFTQKANQIYILTKNVVSFLNHHKFFAESIYIKLADICPRVIIVVKNEYLTNDEFVELSYSKITEMERIFSKLFNENLDMGLIGSEFLDAELLTQDGFGYSENLTSE
jgi:hypothetical protein